MNPPTLNQVLHGDTLYVGVYIDKDGEQSVDFATCRGSLEDCQRAIRTQYRRGVEYYGVLIVKVQVVEG